MIPEGSEKKLIAWGLQLSNAKAIGVPTVNTKGKHNEFSRCSGPWCRIRLDLG
jgi:hypothetical protein